MATQCWSTPFSKLTEKKEDVLEFMRHTGMTSILHFTCADVSIMTDDGAILLPRQVPPNEPVGVPYLDAEVEQLTLNCKESDAEHGDVLPGSFALLAGLLPWAFAMSLTMISFNKSKWGCGMAQAASESSVVVFQGRVYASGIDPVWHGLENDTIYQNVRALSDEKKHEEVVPQGGEGGYQGGHGEDDQVEVSDNYCCLLLVCGFLLHQWLFIMSDRLVHIIKSLRASLHKNFNSRCEMLVVTMSTIRSLSSTRSVLLYS